MSGVRCDAELTLDIDTNNAKASKNDRNNAENILAADNKRDVRMVERGELQLTDYGVSGIPVFQLSSPAAQALKDKKTAGMRIDFLPDISAEDLKWELSRRVERSRSLSEQGANESRATNTNTCDSNNTNITQTMEQILCGLLNQKLIPIFIKEAGITVHTPVAQVNEKQMEKLLCVIKNYKITLDKVRDFEFAQVCAGGIRTEEIDTKTLESKLVPGLYFAGEILDVDGICGGYNLQWAWSSGFVAGTNV